jgi:hypothetical protein
VNRKAWTFVDSETSEAFCERCGGREKLPLPMPIDAFAKWAAYFNRKHKYCKPKEAK